MSRALNEGVLGAMRENPVANGDWINAFFRPAASDRNIDAGNQCRCGTVAGNFDDRQSAANTTIDSTDAHGPPFVVMTMGFAGSLSDGVPFGNKIILLIQKETVTWMIFYSRLVLPFRPSTIRRSC
jgi:hypothetical protein